MSAAAPIRTPIKFCGFTREADVDAAVALGVDYIGFVLYPPSPRAVSIERAAELAQRLPPSVTPVLLYVNEDASKVIADFSILPRAMAQFHGDESPAYCHAATLGGQHPHWRVARIPTDPAAPPYPLLEFCASHSNAQAILLDALASGYGGSGQTFPWSQLPPNVSSHLVLSGGLTPSNVADGMRTLRQRCPNIASLTLDVSSGIEAAKGIKDPERMAAFVQAVRAADAA